MRPVLKQLLSPLSPYLLYDRFLTALSAGAVNNTVSDTGQVRTVTDTNSKLTIASNLLTFATGGAGIGDPALWYSAFARTPGLTFLGTINMTSGGQVGFGWDNGQSGGVTGSGVVISASFLVLNVDTSGTPSLGITLSTSTDYQLASVLRASGHFLFIKGGTFTNWTLIWIGAANSGTPLYPSVGVNNLTASVFTAKNLKVPSIYLIFLPSASDSFVRSNGSLGSTDGLGTQEYGGVGLSWNGSTWTISSNKAINTPTLGSDDVVNGGFGTDTDWSKGSGWSISGGKGVGATTTGNLSNSSEANSTVGTWYQSTFDVSSYSSGTLRVLIDGTAAYPSDVTANGSYVRTGRSTNAGKLAFKGQVSLSASVDNATRKALTLSTLFASILSGQTNDVLASVDVTLSAGTQAGIVLNLDSESAPANFILAYHDGVNAHLDKCVGGTYTSLVNASATYSAGASLKVSKRGTSYSLWYNGTLIGTVQTVSDAGIISNTKHGLFSTYSGNSLANFTLIPTGANNEYAILDSI